MTHADLVKRAASWLRRTKGCGVVLTEHTTGEEFPDAIGYRRGGSIMVECKVSRSDFFADQKKPSRQRGQAERPAWQCWYLTPPGLLKPDELQPWWGLLEAGDRLVRVVKAPNTEMAWDDRDPSVLRHDVRRLYQEVRRYQAQGLKPLTYAEADRQRRERLPFSTTLNGTPAVDAVGEAVE